MFSEKIVKNLSSSSFIRAMFEEGEKLRKIYGPDKVYDFSIGNPDTEPPDKVKKTLIDLVTSDKPGKHRYMSNSGYQDVREKIAAHVSKENGIELTAEHIIMTVGAAGGLNIALKSLLNPDEEVIVFAPYFVEYFSYIDNHGGKPVVVKPDPNTFEPDLEELDKLVTPKTKAIIINNPHNPTGIIYREKTLKQIAEIIEKKSKAYGTEIFVISDEPYASIVYDNAKVPEILKIFRNSIIINSFSKSLALPGERIGYVAINPGINDCRTLIDAMIYTNRTLGYVNAPALFQKAVAENIDIAVDVKDYQKKRDLLYNHLTGLGFSCIKPQGAFYLFPKALIDDDVEFAKRAVKYNLLLVPGSGFGYPGYLRLAYCVNIKTIENSFPAFEALAKEFGK